jgi:hypothetical protein
VTFRELLDYTAGETARWEAWFAANPDALELPYAAGQLATVRGVVHHIFVVERRHTERLLGRPVSGYDDVPSSPDRALFDAGREARALFASYLAARPTRTSPACSSSTRSRPAGSDRVRASWPPTCSCTACGTGRSSPRTCAPPAARPTDWGHDLLLSRAIE